MSCDRRTLGSLLVQMVPGKQVGRQIFRPPSLTDRIQLELVIYVDQAMLLDEFPTASIQMEALAFGPCRSDAVEVGADHVGCSGHEIFCPRLVFGAERNPELASGQTQGTPNGLRKDHAKIINAVAASVQVGASSHESVSLRWDTACSRGWRGSTSHCPVWENFRSGWGTRIRT